MRLLWQAAVYLALDVLDTVATCALLRDPAMTEGNATAAWLHAHLGLWGSQAVMLPAVVAIGAATVHPHHAVRAGAWALVAAKAWVVTSNVALL